MKPTPYQDTNATQADAIAAMNAVGGVFFGVVSDLGSPYPSAIASYTPIADATGGQMFDLDDLVAGPEVAEELIAAVINACVASTNILGRMTGGGSVFASEPAPVRVTHGFELHCDVGQAPNNLQVNWGKGKNRNRFHLENLDTAACSDDPGIEEAPPVAKFDTYVGTGTGRYNGVSGATIEFTFTDDGEPGKNDVASIEIKDAGGNVVLTVGGPLKNGNHQAHLDN